MDDTSSLFRGDPHACILQSLHSKLPTPDVHSRLPSGCLDPAQISWIGRLNAVKMTYLPKLLYFFRVLQVEVPPHILHILQHKIQKYIWGPTRPRISKSTLYRHKNSGGLDLPLLRKKIMHCKGWFSFFLMLQFGFKCLFKKVHSPLFHQFSDWCYCWSRPKMSVVWSFILFIDLLYKHKIFR